jgi:hypothetical protein
MREHGVDNIETIYSESPVIKIHKVPEIMGSSVLSGFGAYDAALPTSNLVNALLIAGIGAIAYFFILPKIMKR